MVLVLLLLVVSVSGECTQSSVLPGMWSGSQYRYRSLLSGNQGVSPPQRLTGWRTSKRTRPSHLLLILTAPCLSKETVLDLPPTSSLVWWLQRLLCKISRHQDGYANFELPVGVDHWLRGSTWRRRLQFGDSLVSQPQIIRKRVYGLAKVKNQDL